MPTNRRTASLVAVAAAVALAGGLLTGCEVDDSLDCLRKADTIADSLRAIHEAGADESLTAVEENLDRIGRDADDGEVDEAVGDLRRAIEDYNRAVLDGASPDAGEVDAAAEALRDVCGA